MKILWMILFFKLLLYAQAPQLFLLKTYHDDINVDGWVMSEKFDGMYLYEYMGSSLPKYEIRGNYIHEYKKTLQPVYENRGTRIDKQTTPSKMFYEIRKNTMYKLLV